MNQERVHFRKDYDDNEEEEEDDDKASLSLAFVVVLKSLARTYRPLSETEERQKKSSKEEKICRPRESVRGA